MTAQAHNPFVFCVVVVECAVNGNQALALNASTNRGENQALVGAIPSCGEYPGPRFEDKFRSANQMGGISIAGGGKMADR